jgi:MFS transporter, DHA1 family, multidrug resistance protein
MFKEAFIGRKPSHFQVNPLIKAFILSETLLWSAWNFVTPIFAVFVVQTIPGGNVTIAASAFSAYLLVRVLFELISGKYLDGKGEREKFYMTIFGKIILSLSYFGFGISTAVWHIFAFYAVTGIGIGLASPAKYSLFSTHLDKNKETEEWGFYDASVFAGMALSAALGGFIANLYGFSILFYVATVVSLLGVLPYVLYIRHDHPRR